MSTDLFPSAFTAARLTVVTDDRVLETQERARVAGYSAGFAAGSRAAAESTRALQERLVAEAAAVEQARLAEHRAAVAALERAAQAAATRVLPVLDDARDLLFSRSLDLARAIVGHELADTDTAARAALRRALAVPHDVRVQTVRMHPADIARLRATDATGAPASAGTETVEQAANVELVADPALSPGDAVSTFEGGFFDARIETAFERATLALEASVTVLDGVA